MNYCVFVNDDNCNIKLINHHFCDTFKNRDAHESLFRKINTFLIKNKIIKKNIIDSGAWIGDNSIPWAKNIDGIVYAIDPSVENCDFIDKMCESNDILNIKTIVTALSDTNEILTTDNDIRHCSFVYGNTGLNGMNKIESVSLDYLYEKNEIDNIGYIHLDVEGMEYKAINGGSSIIDRFRPIVSFEQHLELEDYNIMLNYFTNKNYKVYLVDEVLLGCRHDCRNSFAFPDEIITNDLITKINNFIGRDILIKK